VISDEEHAVLDGTFNRGHVLAVPEIDVCNSTPLSQGDGMDLQLRIDSQAAYSVFHSANECWLVNCREINIQR
jgi:hypothetical protein